MTDALANEFVAWVMAPERTLDEAFFAELLIEDGLAKWKAREKIDDPLRYDYEAQREQRRRRRLNPAHRRIWSEIDVKRAAEFVVALTELRHWTRGEDRDVCDLSALRFCPQLRALHLAPAELPDLDGLRCVPDLADFWLQDDIIESLSGLRFCLKLKGVHLWLDYPWCDLSVLADLPELEQFTLHGNLPMLAEVRPLQKVTKVLLNGWGNGRASVRNGDALPDMPALRDAQISPIASLAGVEKFTALEEVLFEGPYKSIAPLAALGEVRKLVLGGENYHDITPVARMPKLAVLSLAREFPLDYTPLLESVSLRTLERCGDDPLTPEQAGINAALGDWDADCLLPEPRPLPAPVYRVIDHGQNPAPGFASRSATRAEAVPPPIAEAQGKWLAARLDRVMIRRFGRDWGETYSSTHDAVRGSVDVRIHDIEVADRLPEVIDLLRHELASLRDSWVVDLTVAPKSQWQRDPEAWKDDVEQDLAQRIEAAKDYAARRRDYLAFVERLRVYRERQEQGDEPLPEEFAPPNEEQEEQPESDLLEPTEPGIDTSWEPEDHPKWHDYYLTMDVCEEGVWIPSGFKEKAERLLGRATETYPGWKEKES